MSDALDQLRQTLRQHNQSLTASRRAIFEALQHQEPQTMHEIIHACAGKADRASVYRGIMLFEQLGVVHRIHIGWKYKIELTDTFSHHHHHLACSQCGAVIPLTEDEHLEALLGQLASSHGFQAQSHQLEIRGLCSQCRT